MKKKLFAVLLAAVLVLGLAACGGGTTPATDTPATDTAVTGDGEAEAEAPIVAGTGDLVINLWSFTDELPNMVAAYIDLNPAFGEKYTINTTIVATDDGAYQTALNQALVNGGPDAPDIFAAEAAIVMMYTQGDMSDFPIPYSELGIDVANLISEAEIAEYTVEIGTNPNGDVVALGFQATGGAMIYRRSIAEEVFGSQDPEDVRNATGPGWDQFMSAAATLNDAGYSVLSGAGDLWQVMRNVATTPWIVDVDGQPTLEIDPSRITFMDYHRQLQEGGFTNDAQAWNDAWFADMSGSGAREVFAFMGPAWLINYVMAGNAGDTYGDWGVAVPPAGFFWGGTWVMANSQGNPEVRDGVAELIEWITLDSSDTGLQYHWANGTLFPDNETKDTVASAAVMSRSNGEIPFLAGQNMFDIFVPAGEYASAQGLSQYDERLNSQWLEWSGQYAEGLMTQEEAIQQFKQWVADNLAVTVNFD